MSSRDDFWDIEKLVPKKRSSLRPFATEVRVSEHSSSPAIDESAATRAPSDRRLSFGESIGNKQAESASYIPSGGGLIKCVTVKKYIDKYDFYDSFRKGALLYFDYNAPKCDFAQFYSYMPQYAHLTPSQKNYYFWWRSQMRIERYIKTDYSYLYLYVYEILNLPDKIPPKEGIKLLCRAWREYRAALPRIDAYFAIWIEDYCLVHGLPCPTDELSDFLFDCIGTAPLKEFFLSDINEVGLSGTDALLAYLSDYDWKRGKYAAEQLSSALLKDTSYRSHMIRAMYLLLSEIWNKAVLGGDAKTERLVRDAFPGTLCTHSVKCKLEIEYVSFARSEELRAAVTAAVRYTENKLRALLGIRARLAVKDLPDEYQAVIDRYFSVYMAEEQKRRERAERPEYERLYEAPEVKMSLGGAEEIERLSWQNAQRLVVDEDEIVYAGDSVAEDVAVAPSVPDVIEQKNEAVAASASPLGDEELGYLRRLLGLDAEVALTSPIDSLAERINEVFVDRIGDILLESSDDGYTVIEDYKEEAMELVCSLR